MFCIFCFKTIIIFKTIGITTVDYPKLFPGKRHTLPRPISSADSMLLAEFAMREKAAGRITAIVTADASDAQRLLDEIAFFAPDLQTVMFPDWETLPYDTFSPHQDLISERLATLWRIHSRSQAKNQSADGPQEKTSQEPADVVLIPATTALYRLAPPSFLAGYTFHFKVKQKLDEAKLKAQLTLAGYNHVTQVVSPGEYAVRGGLIDLFPMGSLVPYRVDLFDDEVDSIRTFDPDSQRSLYPCPRYACCRAASFRWTMLRASSFATAGASCLRATRLKAAFIKTWAMA